MADYGPGHDAEASFAKVFAEAGGTVAGSLRVPLRDPDFAAFLQRVADAKPQALFVFLPSGIGAPVKMRTASPGPTGGGGGPPAADAPTTRRGPGSEARTA